jgi:putative lipoic acid-binding regulatory protein
MAFPAEAPSNVNFTQFSNAYLPAWRALIRKNPIAAEILMFLIEHMGKQHNVVMLSQATMMELTGRSRSTISRAIKTLREDNWIDVVQIGKASAYAVNERIAWRTHANQRKYAYFSASIVATSTDQVEIKKSKLKHIPVIDD